jgi:hypothetical protein
MPTFNPQEEKETYQKIRKEILGLDWIDSTSKTPLVYYMPPVYDRTIPNRTIKKLNTLKDFLRICLELMHDETTLNTLRRMIDHFT